MITAEAALQRLTQGGDLGAQPAAGKLGQGERVVLAGD